MTTNIELIYNLKQNRKNKVFHHKVSDVLENKRNLKRYFGELSCFSFLLNFLKRGYRLQRE